MKLWTAVQKHCRDPNTGQFSAVVDVDVVPPRLSGHTPSYFFAETLKYVFSYFFAETLKYVFSYFFAETLKYVFSYYAYWIHCAEQKARKKSK
jgi:hypothetical protein